MSGASGYTVYRNGKQVKNIAKGATVQWTDTKAKTNGTKYQYKVYAYKTVNGKKYTSNASAAVTTYYLKATTLSSVRNNASKKLKVQWKKASKITGYQIQYSTSSKFTKSTTKMVTVKKASSYTKTISGLKKGKKYYVRIRTYKTVSKKNYYSAWSSIKNVKVKK